MASLSLAATLAGGFAITGCGGDNNSTTEDGGDGGVSPDVIVDRGTPPPDVTTMEAGDAPADRVTMDVMEASMVDMTPPPEAGMDVVVMPQCGQPTITPNGGSVVVGSNVTITPAMGFPMGGFIFYTTDGTLPTHSSPLYSGPIQVTQNETIHAIAFAQGTCSDSMLASASFTVTAPEAGSLQPPVFNPQSQVRNNDFLLGLSGTAGSTICYTLDGVTMPTCTVTASAATCGGNSQTYNAATQINITGSITNTTDPTKVGQVMVQAVACEAGAATTSISSQTYTLQAAAPTMVSPAPATIPYTTAGVTPTITSATTGSTIQYTTDGTSMPTCGAGSPGTMVNNSTAVATAITQTTVINAIACKTGYAPSAMPDTLTYTVQLNAPTFTNGTGTYDNAVNPVLAAGTNPGSAYICFSTSGAAGCAANSMCASGSSGTLPASITATGTTLNAVTCPASAAYTMSAAMAAQTYTLTLDQPYLNPPDTTAPTTPTTNYNIPANMTTVTPTLGQSLPHGQAPGFWCAAIGTTTTPPTTPTCGTNACGAGGTYIAFTNFTTHPSLGTAISAGGEVVVVACSAPTVNFGSSMTTVTFGGPNSAGVPTIAPGTELSYTTVQPFITNTDTGTSQITVCYSTSGTPTCTSASPPTCGGTGVSAPITTNFATTALAAAGAAVVTNVVLDSPGSGYTAAPVVTISGPGGTGTAATVTATVSGGVVTGFTGLSGGSGYSTPPTVSFTGGGGSGASAHTITSNQFQIASALSVDPTTLIAVACSATKQQNGQASATYNFQVEEPNFGSTSGATDLNGGGAASGNQTVYVWTASNFGTESIHYTTTANATANCGSGTVLSGASGTVTVPQSATSFYLSAIGCGTNQQPSAAARSATFTVGTATPTITTNQVTSGPNTGKPQTPWENTFTATITSTTSTASICYNLAGNAGCNGGGCDANSTPLANGGTVNIVASETLNAMACSASLGASGPASQPFVLQLPAVTITPTGTCPAASLTFNVALDNSTATQNLGGPTHNATVCYSVDNTTITNCGAVAGHVSCFLSGNGGLASTPIGPFSTTTSVNVEVCSPSGDTFTGSGSQTTASATVTPPYHTPTVDGINGGTSEWPSADTFTGGPNGTTGYFEFDQTNLYFATTYNSGLYSAANDYLAFFLGDNSGNGSTTGPTQLGSPTITFAAQWVFVWNTNTAPNSVTAYSFSGGNWAAATGIAGNVTVGFRAGGFVEFQLPQNAITFANQVVRVAGAVLTGVSTVTPGEPSTWPTGGTNHYVQAQLNACAGDSLQ